MSTERNIRLEIDYDGTAYSGWQVQGSERTIQGEIVQAIHRVTGCQVNLIGAGRTDAGVHALGQVANFCIEHRLEPEKYRDAVNFYLPEDIRVLRSEEVLLEFHARFDARARRYRYLISGGDSAVHRRRRWHFTRELDFERLRRAASMVLGEHDFAPFCVVLSRKENNLCRVDASRWYRYGPLLVYEIRADRFLHGMVRSLVGAMVNLATVSPDHNRLNLTEEVFSDMLAHQTETRAPFTAPAHGLYLVRVIY